jgi:hypothetical protein
MMACVSNSIQGLDSNQFSTRADCSVLRNFTVGESGYDLHPTMKTAEFMELKQVHD